MWKYCNHYHPSENKIIHSLTHQSVVMASYDFVRILLISHNLKGVTLVNNSGI